jgi:hypothetical protein
MSAPLRPWRAQPTRELWRQHTDDLTDEQCAAFVTWLDETGHVATTADQLHALRVTWAMSKRPDAWPLQS